jgi:hypothetical protein
MYAGRHEGALGDDGALLLSTGVMGDVDRLRSPQRRTLTLHHPNTLNLEYYDHRPHITQHATAGGRQRESRQPRRLLLSMADLLALAAFRPR